MWIALSYITEFVYLLPVVLILKRKIPTGLALRIQLLDNLIHFLSTNEVPFF